ncbi:MAG: sulfate transporter CysZ [Gammaproteobacteria bacterium]|nr:sulfate transporter CysZ [Gammaproteobacteria bacterium]NND61147.1 sulfate transporter CysZ [Gammaproteobacteria bacterium]
MTGFALGASYVLAGFRRLADPRLRLYVITPLLINLVLFTAAIIWIGNRFDGWIDSAVAWLPQWLQWVEWLLWPLFGLVMILVMFYTFTMVANIIGAPLNGLLAEKVETACCGDAPPGSGVSFLAEIPRAVGHEFRKWAYILPRALPLLLLFVVPAVNVLAPLLWFGFGAWMLAMEYADYPMGNHGLKFREQRVILRQHRMVALGFGAAVFAMTLVPLLNFLSMPTAVIGATLLWHEQLKPPAKNG